MKKIIFNSIFVLLLLTIGICFIYLISISPYDELWNFQNIYKLYNGLDLYKNATAIITPLFYILSLAFFKIFGATIVSFRILNIILYATLFLLIFHVFKYLKISKHLNFVFLALTFTQVFQIINCGANYNTLCFIIIFIGMLSYFYLEKNKYFHFLQGIIIFLIFFSKQNLGVYYTISILVYEFLYKTNFKTFIINQIKKVSTFLPILLISLYILHLNNILLDFINYAFGGIFNFGELNFSIDASPYLIFICAATLTLYFLFTFKGKKLNPNIFSDEVRKNLNLIACITIGVTFSVFPIANTAHFIFVLPFYFILLFYLLDITILEDFLASKKSIIISYILTFFIVFFVLVRILFFHFVEEKDFVRIEDQKSPFYNIYISQENYEKINVMTNYIKTKESNGKNVIIMSFDSAFTMISLNKNNDEFDLVFNGNLGYNGDSKMIEKIKTSKNTEFLILTDEEDCFWQESKIVRKFILENLNKKGEILNYSIYELEN